MKKKLNITCPHCCLKAELEIEEEAEMILMRCVSCSGPYLYFHGETYEVEENEMENLRKAELKQVEGLLHVDENTDEGVDESFETNSDDSTQVALQAKNKPLHSRNGKVERDQVVGNDDIIDLIIDLETSQDVNEFIAKLK